VAKTLAVAFKGTHFGTQKVREVSLRYVTSVYVNFYSYINYTLDSHVLVSG
jgi:hypothetical protein